MGGAAAAGRAPGSPDRPNPKEFVAVGELRDVHFDFDRYEIRSEDAQVLEANAVLLKSNPKWQLLIEGHADQRGTTEYNLALGDRRARASMNYLVAQGVRSNRISIISYGKERLLCRESSEDCYGPMRLRDATLHSGRHVGRGVSDVDLTARDVVLAAVERCRLGEARDRVLRGGIRRRVRPRRVRRDGAVIDDPPAAWLLGLHELEGFLRAEERAGQVDVDDRFPLLVAQILERHGRGSGPRVVEQQIEPTELRLRPSEEGADRHGIAHVGRNDERPRAGRLSRQRRRLQEVLATAGEDDRVALSQQGKRDGPADSASGARDDGDLVRRSHGGDLRLSRSGVPQRPCRGGADRLLLRQGADQGGGSDFRRSMRRVRRSICDPVRLAK